MTILRALSPIILSIITSLFPSLALEQIVNHLTDQKEVSLLFALAYLGLIVLSDLFASAQNISITIFGLTIEAVVIGLLMIGAAQGQKMQTLFGINAGSAVALIAYVRQIFTPLESIGMEIQSIQDAMAGMSRIQDFLNKADSKPDIYQGEGDYFTFDHVTFGYLPDQPILKDYSFKVAKGEHVTFVGRTGKGKSTIVKLLLGLYQPQKGKILLDGSSPDAHPKN